MLDYFEWDDTSRNLLWRAVREVFTCLVVMSSACIFVGLFIQ